MDLSIYIAKRLISKSSTGFTRVIIKIAVATIALSIVVIICSNALINGFKEEISGKIFGFWGHIHITDTKITRSYESVPIIKDEELEDAILQVKSVPIINDLGEFEGETQGGVKYIQPYAFVPGILNRKETFEGIIIKGVSNDFNFEQMSPYLKRGRFITYNDSVASRDLLISEQTAKRMKIDTADKLIIHFLKDRQSIKKAFKVVGIYKTQLEEYDSKFAICDIRNVQEVIGWNENQITGYEIFLDDIDDAKLVADYIYENHLPQGAYAETIKEKLPNIFDWLDLQDINETIIMLLMVLVSIINMATVILIFILDRSRMIGVLKSVGAKDWSIRKIFILQSTWILFKGMLWGNAIAILLCLLQKYGQFIKLDAESYYVSTAPIRLYMDQVIWINVLVILVTCVWMILPTFIITKIKPVKVLRFG